MSKKKHAKKHHKKLEKPQVHNQVQDTEHKKQHTKTKTTQSRRSFTVGPFLKKICSGTLIGGLIVFMVGFLGFFIIVKMQEPSALAAILPADDTVAFVEFHAAPFSHQRDALWDLIKDTAVYDQNTLTTQLSTWLGVDATTEVLPWVDTTAAGMAVFTSSDEVYFLGIKDAAAAQLFFTKHQVANEQSVTYEDVTLAPFPWQPDWRYAFTDRYLLVGTTDDALQRVIAVMKGNARSLRQSETWGQVDKNLSSVRLGVGFVDLERAIPLTSKVPALVNLLGRDFSVLAPLTQVFPATGFTVAAGDDGLVVQSFTMTRRADGTPSVDLENYDGALAKNFPASPLAFFGGQNFAAQFDDFSGLFTAVHPSGAAIVEGMVRAQIEQLFGSGDLLASDIKPLLQNEYGVGLYGNDFIFEVNGESNKALEDHADAIKNSFLESGAVWQPVIKEVTLPDGTTGKEVQAQQQPIVENSTEINGVTVHSLSFGTHTLFYAVQNDVLIVTSAQELLQQILEGQHDTALPSALATYGSTSQEMTYIDLTKLFATMQFVEPYLAPFHTAVITKSVSNAGTLSVAHVLKAE